MLSSGCFMALYCESSDQITFVPITKLYLSWNTVAKQSRILENSRVNPILISKGVRRLACR